MKKNKYLNLAKKLNSINLVIMGKDPYPNDPTNIPFCKPTWETMLKHNTSGRYVLCSLGVDLTNIDKKFKRPEDLFYELLNKKKLFS